MDKETSTMGVGGFAFIALFLLILFALFNQNGLWGHGRAYAADSCGVSGCDIKQSIWNNEKQGIIDSARTNYNVEAQADATREYLGNKIDFYEYQNLRDRANAAEQRNMFLEGQINDIQRYNLLQNQIAELSCSVLKAPKVYGVGTVCNGSLVPSNLCPTTTPTPAA